MEIGVIGLGKFGLRMATTLVSLGHTVVGLDLSEARVQVAEELLHSVYKADATSVSVLRSLHFQELDWVVICVGEGNSYNLPDSDLLEIFSEREIPVYRTDENGTIVVTVYPEEEKAVSLYLTAQEQTAGSTAEAAKEGLAYAVSRRKITVNFAFGAAIA